MVKEFIVSYLKTLRCKQDMSDVITVSLGDGGTILNTQIWNQHIINEYLYSQSPSRLHK